jgi:hypothetical protein
MKHSDLNRSKVTDVPELCRRRRKTFVYGMQGSLALVLFCFEIERQLFIFQFVLMSQLL